MSGWRDHALVAWVKPYVRSVRQNPGPVSGRVMRTSRQVRRRIARRQHHSIPIVDLRPAEVREANLHLVLDRLARADVPASVVRGRVPTRTYVAVGSEHREAAARALGSGNSAPHLRVQVLRASEVDTTPQVERSAPLVSLRSMPVNDDVSVMRVFAWHDTTPDTLTYGPQYACDVEFWTVRPDGWRVAPRVNGFASRLAPELFEPVGLADVDPADVGPADVDPADVDPASVDPAGVDPGGRVAGARHLPVARGVHRLVTLDDVVVPIDAVYVWRDDVGTEPGRRRTGVPSSRMLTYTLRSLDMFAPWLRMIHVVALSPFPASIVPDHRLRVIDLRDRDAPASLRPESVEMWWNGIDGFAEHIVYFDGRSLLIDDVHPDTYFTAAGQIKAFEGVRAAPIGSMTSVDLPDDIATMHAIELVERVRNRRALQARRRVPLALRRDAVQHALELVASEAHGECSPDMSGGEFPIEEMAQLLAQIAGDAVMSGIASSDVDLADDEGLEQLRALVSSRNRRVIGFADVAHGRSVRSEEACALLDRLLPVRSRWER